MFHATEALDLVMMLVPRFPFVIGSQSEKSGSVSDPTW